MNMRTWLIPAVAIALLAAAPVASAAPPDSATQQDQHRGKKAKAGADNNNVVNSNNRTVVKKTVVKDRDVIVGRPVEVNRHVRVNRNVDLRAYRRNFNAPKRFHWNPYRRPPHWYAHRWTYGERLPHGWFARDYWISSFLMFGLTTPPDGYVWVRVGDDALLVDEDTGEVVQVVYGIFY
jgi:Ni/Co efflux regulator RcnB